MRRRYRVVIGCGHLHVPYLFAATCHAQPQDRLLSTGHRNTSICTADVRDREAGSRRVAIGIVALLFATLLLVDVSIAREEPEFYMFGNDCKTAIGSLVSPGDPVRLIGGTPFLYACSRSAKEITCALRAKDGAASVKGPTVKFAIALDSPPDLIFASDSGADFVMVNATQHAFVVVTRTGDATYGGAKVCQGTYVTANEKELLERWLPAK